MAGQQIVILIDVDNTLVDNDRVVVDLMNHLQRDMGEECRDRYLTIFEHLRSQLGYADYLGALQRYRTEHPLDLRLMRISSFLLNYPFANRLFPNSLDAVEHVRQWGLPVILSDGDVVFQPHKVERAGLRDAFGQHILIYVHKEQELDDVARRYPADHYVLVDDKLRILTAVKQAWGKRVTTVLPKQGHYAHDSSASAQFPAPDLAIDRIGGLMDFDLSAIMKAAG